jgi:hypothetical protein
MAEAGRYLPTADQWQAVMEALKKAETDASL